MKKRLDRSRVGSRSNHAMLEALEGRRLLSGNVAVTVDVATSTINIKGDNKSNGVQVLSVAGGYFVIGLPGTTVNGGAGIGIPAVLGTTNLNIDTGNGEDSVIVSGVNVPGFPGKSDAGSLSIDTGNGEDTVSTDTFVAGIINIDTGNGSDAVTLKDTGSITTMNVDTGNGSDAVAILGLTGANGDVNIGGGRGPDTLTGASNIVSFFGSIHVKDFESIV